MRDSWRTLVAWLIGAACLCLPSCAHLGGAAGSRPAPLLGEPLAPSPASTADLLSPPVEVGSAGAEAGVPRTRDQVPASEPALRPASPLARSPSLPAGVTESSFRPPRVALIDPIAPAAPVAELSLRAGIEPSMPATRRGSSEPVLPRFIARAAARPAVAPAQPQKAAVRTPAVSPPVAVPAATAPPADRVITTGSDADVEVSLAGEGWVLVGLQGTTGADGSAGLRFVRREPGRESTAFSFHAERLGEYMLSFQRQDLAAGRLGSSRVQVKVLAPEQAAASASGRVEAGAGAIPASEGDGDVMRAAADRLFALGLNKAALQEYRKILATPGAGPDVTERIAVLCERLGQYVEALSQWRSLLSLSDYKERAVAGVVRAASAVGDGERVESSLDSLFRVQGFPIERELAEIARYSERAGEDGLELTVLEEYLSRYPGGADAAEVYYRLGLLLEKAWEGRDLKRSRECYEKVLADYSTSAFALPSGDRLDYLKRHFYYVR